MLIPGAMLKHKAYDVFLKLIQFILLKRNQRKQQQEKFWLM